MYNRISYSLFIIILFVVAACTQNTPDLQPTAVIPTPSATVQSTVEPLFQNDPNFIVIATDAPYPPFTAIDNFGQLTGFDAAMIENVAAKAGLSYEFVVTSYDGILESLNENNDFDAVMSGLLIPDNAPEGVVFTIPYLEVGQLMLVRANEPLLQSAADLTPATLVGVTQNSRGLAAAAHLGIVEPSLKSYDSVPNAVQALINENVQAVILDSDDAEHYAQAYIQQLKIAGGNGRDNWITTDRYGIAIGAQNSALLEKLNAAITALKDEGTIDRLTRAWLIPSQSLAAGESLIGTPANELVLGIVGDIVSIDPVTRFPNLIDAEIKRNTMSGLYMNDADNNLIPILADGPPLVSEDKLTYIFKIRQGVVFPGGSELTAFDVESSVQRASRQGHHLVNAILKDEDNDGFADPLSVRAIDALTIRFTLEIPLAYFPSLLASQSYYVLPQDCVLNLNSITNCSGIGPYTTIDWKRGESMQLKANPQWPGPAPAFENIQIRFYDSSADLRRAIERNAVDIAWNGLESNDIIDLRRIPQFKVWEGTAVFKSYLVFEQSQPPWDDVRIRQAAAYAVDREALATDVFSNLRQPLYSPVPNGVPGHLAAEPKRDLSRAKALLQEAGYNEETPLAITLWYLNDGRYSPLENSYAQALKTQLEETKVFVVTLESERWEIYRPDSSSCKYPAFLLGWPSPNYPPAYLDPSSWIEYFISSTDKICSNYDATRAKTLLSAAEQAIDPLEPMNMAEMHALYGELQELWAETYPAVDLTQEQRILISTSAVNQVQINASGLLHYESLSKGGN